MIAIGTRVGPYEVLALLGAGGMGEVYRARDTRLDRVVALKVIAPGTGAGPEALSRFEREAKAVAALSHPNILALHDCGMERDTPYFVTELLEGESLRAKIVRGPIPPRKAVEYALQIARGLAAAHEKGIVHRDLKPGNLFVTTDGQVKILDFGLARMQPPGSGPASAGGPETQGPTAPVATRPGVVLGTIPYMSPEQVRGQPVDHRSDIFSFGAVLHEMLVGKRAFAGETAADTMGAILKEEPPDLVSSARNLPPGLGRIVEHCLEKRPEERFQNARDLTFALESVSGASSPDSGATTGGAPAPGMPDSPAPAAGAGRLSWRRLVARPFVAGMVAFAILTAAGIGVLVGLRTAARRIPPQRSFQQLTYQPLTVYTARYGLDNRTVFFSATRGATLPEIYSVNPEYPEPHPVGMRETDLLAISSRGEMAVLVHPRDPSYMTFEGTLSVVAVGGTAPRPLVENVRGADWSPDGSQMAVIRRVHGAHQLEYPVGTVLCSGTGYLSHPRISPGGDRVAFFDHPVWIDNGGAVAVVDREGRRTVIADDFASLDGLAWSADGRKVIFSGSRTGTKSDIWVAGPGAEAVVAMASPTSTILFDVGRDEQWLLSRNEGRQSAIVCPPGAAKARDLSWLDYSLPIRLSPDGGLLLFVEQSDPAGAQCAVCVRSTDGAPSIRLGDGFALDLSPDQQCALARVPTVPPRLVVYRVGAGEPRTLDTGDVAPGGWACWSHDGARIFFDGREPGHPRRVYALDPSGGRPRAITPEGSTIYSISPEGSVVMRDKTGANVFIPAEGDTPRPIPGDFPPTMGVTQHWSRDGGSILVWDPIRVPTPIEWFNLTTGQRTPFATFDPGERTGVMGVGIVVVSGDERSYAVSVSKWQDFLYNALVAR